MGNPGSNLVEAQGLQTPTVGSNVADGTVGDLTGYLQVLSLMEVKSGEDEGRRAARLVDG